MVECDISKDGAQAVSEIFLSRADIKSRGVTYSNPHLLRLERAGKFPRRIVLSSSRVAWRASEIDAWFAERVADRDGEAA